MKKVLLSVIPIALVLSENKANVDHLWNLSHATKAHLIKVETTNELGENARFMDFRVWISIKEDNEDCDQSVLLVGFSVLHP